MGRMRRQRFMPTASFSYGQGTNSDDSRRVRTQCNSAFYLKVDRRQPWPRSLFPSVFGKIDRP